MSKIEIACFNAASALSAQKANADRVELCSGIEVGGTTPDLETVKIVRKNLNIDVFVMIRPRGGDFVYSDLEFEQMKESIVAMKNLGVAGFVFGIVNPNKTIDQARNTALVELAKPYPCTFHRAFDEVSNVFESLETVIASGFTTILTSGAKLNVVEGMHVLKQLVITASNRITIMPGGGLRSNNLVEISTMVQADFYHSSAIVDSTNVANYNEILALKATLND